MYKEMRSGRRVLMGAGLAVIAGMVFGVLALAPIATAEPGQTLDVSGLIAFDQAFFAFEVEDPLESLKDTPQWNELEKLLDNPYAFTDAPDIAGNVQGWPSYIATIQRRRSFLPHGCQYNDPASGAPACNDSLLPPLVVHPLNYDHMTGEEMRLINPEFPGGDFDIPSELIEVTPGTWEWQYETVTISPGSERFDPDEEEAAIDHNSPIVADDPNTCITSTEPFPAEGAILCGGDPGEPGDPVFGLLDMTDYSTPAVPGGSFVLNDDGTKTVASVVGKPLFDPSRGNITPRNATTGAGGLRKPSLRVPEFGGRPNRPNYLINSAANLSADPAALVPSNENDYVRDRETAIALGKSLFWDMQVGSDSVQSCATCHFAAGVDARDRNQLNPNHLGNDFDFEVFSIRGAANPQNNNQPVVAGDFPFHKLDNPAIPGERATDGDGIVDSNAFNVVSHTNDVMSSMGVIFGKFRDIPTPNGGTSSAAFIQTPAPKSLAPDLRSTVATENVDPIAVFRGLRRVEPRQTPTFFAAALNFDNFWDGRARHDFNGGSVFGAADPFSHVFACQISPLTGICPIAGSLSNRLQPTRQIIRFSSLASLATGPALSEFEMSFLGRNWAKIGKRLLQVGVTPLANQLVSPHDSVLGRFSNQPGNSNPVCSFISNVLNNQRLAARAANKPGLCITYGELIGKAFYPALWSSALAHLNGTGTCNAADTGAHTGILTAATCDPFDGYKLSVANGPAIPMNTNQFTQMEANMSLFFGLSVNLWGSILIPDDTPEDQFFDANPDAFMGFGEANEPLLVDDLLTCGDLNLITNQPQGQPCITETGNFKRDNGLIARLGATLEGGTDATPMPASGTRQSDQPDPLLGLDMFLGSNLSLKNPNFRSFRCGECHASGTLTDATFAISHQVTFIDFIQEFFTGQPGIELTPEPLGRSRTITGFALEGELAENAQDAIERNVVDFCTVEPCRDAYGNPMDGDSADGFPQGQALLDNGIYDLGVTPIENDVSRGGDDPFGWPLSLSVLALKNLGGPNYHPGGNNPADNFAQPHGLSNNGNPLPTFDPTEDPECALYVGAPDENYQLAIHDACNTGGLFDENPQDQQLNPGFAEEPNDPKLPPHLAPWASNIPVGDETQADEVFVGLNTTMREPMLEGFLDNFGPFNPASILVENFNMADGGQMATWPNVNRVNHQGSFKAAPLRNVELSPPFFHNGGKLTLRQVVDFYLRGGDFPRTNASHRDFLVMDLFNEDEALGGLTAEEEALATKDERITALVDFLLELTDDRVRFEQAPFDHPEVFVPLDGKAPDNTFGRPGFLARTVGVCPGGSVACFKQVPAVGVTGSAAQVQTFLNVQKGDRNNPNCNSAVGPVSHYCSEVQ